MPAALVAIEGFLMEVDSIRGRHPLPDVLRLVGNLNGPYKVILSSAEPEASQEKLEYSLMVNGIVQGRTYDTLLMRQVQWGELSEADLRVEHFKHVRMNSGMSALFFSGDADACAKVMYAGGNVLLWSRAQYARPEFRPDRPKPRAWSDLAEEAERQVFLRREDERLSMEHEESEFQT